MTSHPLVCIRHHVLSGLWIALASTPALAVTPAAGASVSVRPAYFVVAGRAFADADGAAQALQLSTAQPVRIDTSVPGASRSLAALVCRLPSARCAAACARAAGTRARLRGNRARGRAGVHTC
jgi:hypothetical protein